MVCMVGCLSIEDSPISIFKRDRFEIYGMSRRFICVYSITMRSYKKSRRSRSRRHGRLGGSTPPPNNMNDSSPNAHVNMNVNESNAQPMNIYDDDNMPPAPPLVHAASNPHIYAPPAPLLIHEQVHQLNPLNPPNPQNPPAQGALGLVFAPPPGVQLPGAQPGPHNPQGPIGGRKSRRRKSHRRKSYRRKSQRC